MSAPHATVPGVHPLDNPARASLTGPHAHFAERLGRILRYPTDVSPWLALPDLPDAEDWADVAALTGPGGSVTLTALREPPPGDWEVTFRAEGVQLVDEGWTRPRTRRPSASARPMCRRCSTWSHGPAPDRSCRAPSSSAPTWVSAATGLSSP